MYRAEKKLTTDLHFFLACICALIIIGLLFIYSSSSIYALEKFGSGFYFVKKQMYGLALGITGLFIFRIVPLEWIKKGSPYFFISSVIFTSLTLIPALSLRIHGASRWLSCAGFSCQPSELLKISLIVYLAYFLSKKERKLASFSGSYLPFLVIVTISCLVLLKQPDFGMAVTVALTSFMLFFVMHITFWQFFITLGSFLPISLLLIFKYPYRLNRIMIFLNPWSDPQGAGFQIIQSLIAIGSGSFWGMGVSHSKQKFFYLPMQHTDFIFSIIAEETGFLGASLLIGLYILILYFGLRIAWQLKDMFSILVTLGFIFLVSLQAIINLGVATGLAPTKGIGLPFVSYGNSALIASLCMVGIICNCVAQNIRH